ncbi:MAG: DNA-binding protein [Rhizobiales bacterium]|uniref:DNA-binding protein n=1 Tax=Xanthobacter sp. TaxID=35809 RepID=UPI001AC275CB|nr:DNA-binding protein [Xanthobacter sp.]MBN8916344.1 DNA-binding protein [Hyphomicrobiales bacterium]
MSDKYLTTKQASIYVKLSGSMLAKLRIYGGGPSFIKAGKKVLYVRDDLDTWMTSRIRANTSQPVA